VIALGVVALVASIARGHDAWSGRRLLVSVRDVILNNLGLANIPVRPAANAIVWETGCPGRSSRPPAGPGWGCAAS
jgi:iron complex transport system permease protein